MGPNELEEFAAILAAAVIRNKGLKNGEAAAQTYFECLDALIAERRLKNEEENRQFLSSS